MESKHKRSIRKILGYFVVILLYLIAAGNSIMSEYLSENYSKAVAMDAVKGYPYEENAEYYIMASKVNFFSADFLGVIELKDIYYSPEHPTINVALDVYINKLGRRRYLIRIEDFDPGKEDFGGYAWVDEGMNYLPENKYDTEYNDFIQNLMDMNHEAISRLIAIANERWNLGLVYEAYENK